MNTQPYRGEEQVGTSPAGAQSRNISAILVADCGTVFTKVSLLGLVEGQYRLMARGEAPTTVTAPFEDITQGIIQAINEIEFITGRRIISDGRILFPEQSNGDGVDVFVSTISAGGPIRIVVLGAVSPALIALAKQAVSGLYAETYALPAPSYVAIANRVPQPVGAGNVSFPLSPTPSPDVNWERQLEHMQELQPHAALIVGMADGPAGPSALQEASQLLVSAVQELNEQHSATVSAGIAPNDIAMRQLPVIYAGAPQYVEAVQRMLQGLAEVAPVEGLVSQAQLRPINLATNSLYERDVIQRVSGYDRLRSWSSSVPVTTAASLSSLVRFLSQHYSMNVTAVDVGGATTTVLMAGEKGEFAPIVNAGVGVGPGIGAIFQQVQQVGLRRLSRWLPFDITEDELRQYVLNRMLHPQVIPISTRDLQIGQAFAREAINLTLELATYTNPAQFRPDLILATGGVLAHAPTYGQVALLLLDTLQPQGVTSIVLDRTMLISQLGAVATVSPVAAVQVNENDAVAHRLGTCVVPYGEIQHGQLAVRIGLEYRDGRQATFDVIGGTIKVIPLSITDQAALTLTPGPTVDVGLGPGERARAAEEIDGGLVGLIVDARGRPLALPADETERRTRLTQWMQALSS
jgi:hypothetical protein